MTVTEKRNCCNPNHTQFTLVYEFRRTLQARGSKLLCK